MSEVERSRETTEFGSSVTIEESAKGPRVTVKVRVPDTAEAVREAQEIAQATYAGTIEWLAARGLRGAAA